MSELPPLDDLLGREVEHEGARWTVVYDKTRRALALQRRVDAGVDQRLMLAAIRSGAMVPAPEMLAELEGPIPDAPELRADEARIWDAVLEGDRVRRTLTAVDRERIAARLERLG